MSVNKVILVGNVGKDPEMKYFDNDVAKANFSLATSERGYTTSNGTQVPERTEWHNIVCWRGLAQIAEKLVKKGSLVYIEGKIRSRSYDDQNGVKRNITEVVADSLELLSRGKIIDEGDENHTTGSYTPPASNTRQTETNMPDIEDNSEVDDLPF